MTEKKRRALRCLVPSAGGWHSDLLPATRGNAVGGGDPAEGESSLRSAAFRQARRTDTVPAWRMSRMAM